MHQGATQDSRTPGTHATPAPIGPCDATQNALTCSSHAWKSTNLSSFARAGRTTSLGPLPSLALSLSLPCDCGASLPTPAQAQFPPPIFSPVDHFLCLATSLNRPPDPPYQARKKREPCFPLPLSLSLVPHLSYVCFLLTPFYTPFLAVLSTMREVISINGKLCPDLPLPPVSPNALASPHRPPARGERGGALNLS